MIQVSILFHVLLSFFGKQNSMIVCSKAVITFEPAHNTMLIVQEDIFGIAMTPADTQQVLQELSDLMAILDDPFMRQQEGYRIEEAELNSPDGRQLNARIRIRWTDPAVLQNFGLHPVPEGGFAMVDISGEVTRAPDATKQGNYLLFSGISASTITMEPFRHAPRDVNEVRFDLMPAYRDWSKK